MRETPGGMDRQDAKDVRGIGGALPLHLSAPGVLGALAVSFFAGPENAREGPAGIEGPSAAEVLARYIGGRAALRRRSPLSRWSTNILLTSAENPHM